MINSVETKVLSDDELNEVVGGISASAPIGNLSVRLAQWFSFWVHLGWK